MEEISSLYIQPQENGKFIVLSHPNLGKTVPVPLRKASCPQSGNLFSNKLANIQLESKQIFSKIKSSPFALFQKDKLSAFVPFESIELSKGSGEQTANRKISELCQTDSSQESSEVHSEKQDAKEETPKEYRFDCEGIEADEYEELHSYKGNNRFHTAGANAHRKDVVFKTLVRSIRRYLWHVFKKNFDIERLGRFKKSQVFEDYVCEFYEKNIKSKSETAMSLSVNDEADVCYFIGTMATKDYTFPDIKSNRNNERIRVHKIFNEITKSFSVFKFYKFFNSSMSKNTMKVLKESGFISKVINLYKPLAVLKERYEMAVEVLSNPTDENIKLFDN